MKYRNRNIKNDLYQFYYDPYRLISKFDKTFEQFAEDYEFEFERFIDNYISHNIKDVYTDKRYVITFIGKGPQTEGINYRFIIPIPDISSNMSLNVRFTAFFPKKLTDTLFSLNSVSKDDIRVNIRMIYGRTLDVFVSEKSQEKIHLTDNVIVRDKLKTLSNILYVDEQVYQESKDIAESFKLKPKKPDTVSFERGYKLLKLIFKVSDIAKLYFRNEFELLLYSILLTHTKNPPYSYDNDNGISLVHKRLINEEDMIYYSVVFIVIQSIIEKIRNTDKRTFSKQIDLAGLLSRLGLYEQFNSPTSFISDINRVDPLEPLGCIYKDKAEKVPLNLRDIHNSYYGIFDPYTQSDKEKTGVYNWLSCSSEIDKYGRFVDLLDDEYILFTNALYTGCEKVGYEKIKNDNIDFDNLPTFTKSLYDVLSGRYKFDLSHPFYRCKVNEQDIFFDEIESSDNIISDTDDNDDSHNVFVEELVQTSENEVEEIEYED